MAGQNDMRFSDGELQTLRTVIDDHIKLQEERWLQIGELVATNSSAVKDLAAALERTAASSEGVVNLYADLQAAARVGVGLQKFLLWLAKWGVIGGALAAILRFSTDKFTS